MNDAQISVAITSVFVIATPFALAVKTRRPVFFWIGLGALVWIGSTAVRLVNALGTAG